MNGDHARSREGGGGGPERYASVHRSPKAGSTVRIDDTSSLRGDGEDGFFGSLWIGCHVRPGRTVVPADGEPAIDSDVDVVCVRRKRNAVGIGLCVTNSAG